MVAGKESIMDRTYSFAVKRAYLDDLLQKESLERMVTVRNVVIVMDAMKDFNTEALEWALKNVLKPGSVVTLLGCMPWLNIPLSSKTTHDVWSVELEELSVVRERTEWMSDVRYLKLQATLDLCKNYGVILQKKVVMDFPIPPRVVHEITRLNATWVVLDRHQKSERKFYADNLPCINMVMMNEDGEADMIKGRSMLESPIGESLVSLVSSPVIMISDHLKDIFKKPKQSRKFLKGEGSREKSQDKDYP